MGGWSRRLIRGVGGPDVTGEEILLERLFARLPLPRILVPWEVRSWPLGAPACWRTFCIPAKRLSPRFRSVLGNDGPVGGPCAGLELFIGLGGCPAFGALVPACNEFAIGDVTAWPPVRADVESISALGPWIAFSRSGWTLVTSGNSATGVDGVEVEAGGGRVNGAELRGGALFDGPVGVCLSGKEGEGMGLEDVGDT